MKSPFSCAFLVFFLLLGFMSVFPSAYAWSQGEPAPVRLDGFAYINGTIAPPGSLIIAWGIDLYTNHTIALSNTTILAAGFFQELNIRYDDPDTTNIDEGVTYNPVGENITFTINNTEVVQILPNEYYTNDSFTGDIYSYPAKLHITSEHSGNTYTMDYFSGKGPAIIINLLSPPNCSVILDTYNITFIYNATSILSTLVNCSLYINNLLNQTQPATNGINNFSTGLNDGNYSWFVSCINSKNVVVNSSVFFFTISLDSAPPIINITAPLNNSLINSITFFNSTIIDDNLANTTYLLKNSSGYVVDSGNLHHGFNNSYYVLINTSLFGDGVYRYEVHANDSVGNNATSFIYVVLDNTPPLVSLISPLDHSNFTTSNLTLNFSVVESIASIVNCTLFMNSSANWQPSQSKLVNMTNPFSFFELENLPDGTYLWNVRCSDGVNEAFASANYSFIISKIKPSKNITVSGLPEGIFTVDPGVPLATGSAKFGFNITLLNITARAGWKVGCFVNQSNCYDSLLPGCRRIFINRTLQNDVFGKNITIYYKLSSSDSLNTTNGGTTSLWIPWRITECGVYYSNLSTISYTNISWRIHVHGLKWDSGDIANAVNARYIKNQYFFNTIRTDNQGDVAFSVAKYGGAAVEEYCHDSVDSSFATVGFDEADTLVDCLDPDCFGITYSCTPKQDFDNSSLWYSPSGSHGTLASNIPPGDIQTTTTSSETFNTKIDYSMHQMPSGIMKIRFSRWGISKIATIIIDGLPDIKTVTKYAPGNSQAEGLMEYFLDNNGRPVRTNTLNENQTYLHKIVIKSFDNNQYITNLDTVVNISFKGDDINLSEGYILRIRINYVEGSAIYTEQRNITVYFDNSSYASTAHAQGDNRPRWNSSNMHENDIWLNSSLITWHPCADAKNGDFDYLNCTNNAECFERQSYDCYDPDCNNYLGTPAWNDYTHTFTQGLCNYGKEEICNDGYNNDWASESFSWGHADTSLTLVDCRDPDCDLKQGAGGICQYNIELNCSDGFDNDMYNLFDCNQTRGATYNNAEYDCASYCRLHFNVTTEKICDDGIDNDWDLWYTTTGGPDGYARNTAYGTGIDCGWITNFPDEDCNLTMLSNHKRCELGHELTCNDSFDNDYDNGHTPRAGWTFQEYMAYFNHTFAPDADCDDYDCAGNPACPMSESLNPEWCFDGVDNDLDAYYYDGSNLVLNYSTGVDCADPDCLGVVNPANPEERCMPSEFNLSMHYQYCADTIDNDYSLTDNVVELAGYSYNHADDEDLDCWRKFGYCGPSPTYENITWDSCADHMDNDHDNGYNLGAGWKYNGTDCGDKDCIGELGDYDGHICALAENTAYLCSDGFDNDADSLVDCLDPDCDNIGICEYAHEIDCSDDEDNDGDGLIDCMDSDCECNLTSHLSNALYSPRTTTANYDGLLVRWNDRVRTGTYENISLYYPAPYDSANIYIGNLMNGKLGLPVNQGLQGALFSVGGENSTLFETTTYSEDASHSKGQIALYDQDHAGSYYNGFNVDVLIPTNKTMPQKTFELFYAISGHTSNDNFINVLILDNISPVVYGIITEPTHSPVKYGGSLWVGVNAADPDNGDFMDGYIYGCYYTVSGPSYGLSGFTHSCRFYMNNLVNSGNYTIQVKAMDCVGNIGQPRNFTVAVSIVPSYIDNSFTISPVFYHSSDTINISAKFYSEYPETTCTLILNPVNGTNLSYIIPAYYMNNIVHCNATINAPSLDNMYRAYVTINNASSTAEVFYVCDSLSSHGQGWSCAKADFDNDGVTEGLITTLYGPPQPCDMCVGLIDSGIDKNANGIDDVCEGNQTLSVSLISPPDNYRTNTSTTFRCQALSNLVINNITLFTNLSGAWQPYATRPFTANYAVANFTINLSSYPTSIYSWNCLATVNSTLNRTALLNRTFILDHTPPLIKILNPVNLSHQNNSKVVFEFNATDDFASTLNCTLSVRNTTTVTDSKTFSIQPGFMHYSNFTKSLVEGTYLWNITCSDGFNSAVSPNLRLIISYNTTFKPRVILLLPPNNSVSSSHSVNFHFNVSDSDSSSLNCTLFSTTSGSWQDDISLRFLHTQQMQHYNITLDGISAGTYVWNILCSDGINSSFAPANDTFSIVQNLSDTTPPTVKLLTRQYAYFSGVSTLECAVYDNPGSSLANVSLFTNYSGFWHNIAYSIQGGSQNRTVSFSYNFSDGIYEWNCLACDMASNCAYDHNGNRIFIVDRTPPVVTSILPVDYSEFTTNSPINFRFRVDDDLSIINWCALIVDSLPVRNITNVALSQNITINYLPSAGDHTWQIKCLASNNLAGYSAIKHLHRNTAHGGGGGGSGGGGGGIIPPFLKPQKIVVKGRCLDAPVYIKVYGRQHHQWVLLNRTRLIISYLTHPQRQLINITTSGNFNFTPSMTGNYRVVSLKPGYIPAMRVFKVVDCASPHLTPSQPQPQQKPSENKSASGGYPYPPAGNYSQPKPPLREHPSYFPIRGISCFFNLIIFAVIAIWSITFYLLFSYKRSGRKTLSLEKSRDILYVKKDYMGFIYKIREFYILILLALAALILFAMYYQGLTCGAINYDCSMLLCYLIIFVIALFLIGTYIFLENIRKNLLVREENLQKVRYFLRVMLKKGFSYEQLADILRKHGWKEPHINRIFTEINNLRISSPALIEKIALLITNIPRILATHPVVYTYSQIREQALKVGWPQENVDEGLTVIKQRNQHGFLLLPLMTEDLLTQQFLDVLFSRFRVHAQYGFIPRPYTKPETYVIGTSKLRSFLNDNQKTNLNYKDTTKHQNI